jgi:RimJ/RimL family protein N-acetyltransferase
VSVIIREARQEDADQLITHITAIADDPSSEILLWPGIVGVLSCAGGEHRGNHHTTTLGITIHKDWRNQGIGRALMERAIDWVKATGVVKRIQLGVTSTNTPAIHLYEKLGFEKEGLRRRGMFKNGRYYDTWLMGLLVD